MREVHDKYGMNKGLSCDLARSDDSWVEESPRRSEERYCGAFENVIAGMALVTLDGHVLRVDRAPCSVTQKRCSRSARRRFPLLRITSFYRAPFAFFYRSLRILQIGEVPVVRTGSEDRRNRDSLTGSSIPYASRKPP